MNLIDGHDAEICEWLAARFGMHVVRTPRNVLGVVDDQGFLHGAMVITWHHDTTAELSVFGTVTPDTVKRMFQAVFVIWGAQRLEIRTSRKNKPIKRAAPKWGFKFEGVARNFYGRGEDALCYGMLPTECRWIHGQLVSDAEGTEAA